MRNRIPISTIVTATCFGMMLLIVVIVLVQNRNLSQSIKDQTDINQRFFRCLLLLPQDPNRTAAERVALVDKCAVESRLPNGQSTGKQPTSRQQQDFQKNNKPSSPTPKAEASSPKPPSSAPRASSSPQPSQPSPPSAQPNLIQQITKPVTNLIKAL